MFKRRRNNMLLPFSFSDFGRRDNSLIVRFASTGGKIDFPCRCPKARRYPLPGRLQRFRSPLPCPVQTGRITPYGFHVWQHCLNGRRAHLCRRRIVGIYHMITQVISSFLYYTPIIPPVAVQGALTAFRSFASASVCILPPARIALVIVIASISYYVNGFYMDLIMSYQA